MPAQILWETLWWQLVAQLDDLRIDHYWLFVLIISASYQQRDWVHQCTTCWPDHSLLCEAWAWHLLGHKHWTPLLIHHFCGWTKYKHLVASVETPLLGSMVEPHFLALKNFNPPNCYSRASIEHLLSHKHLTVHQTGFPETHVLKFFCCILNLTKI